MSRINPYNLRLMFVEGQPVVVDRSDPYALPGDQTVVRRCGEKLSMAGYYEARAAGIPHGKFSHDALDDVNETGIIEIVGRVVTFQELSQVSGLREVPVDFVAC